MPGRMPSVRGCRSHGVADVVVGVVGACACWERAGMVGATTEVATVAMPDSIGAAGSPGEAAGEWVSGGRRAGRHLLGLVCVPVASLARLARAGRARL